MPELMLHIARDGAAVGTFTLEEVRELAETGFVQPTDEVWFRGLDEWQPLETVLRHANASQVDWRDRVIAGTTALSGLLGRRVGKFVAGVKAHTAQGQDPVAKAKQVTLEQFLPQLQKRAAEYLRDKPATFARAAVQNDDMTHRVFGGIYNCLPKPLTRFVSEEDFVAFCMKHRQRLLTNPTPAAANPSPPGEAPAPASPDDAPRT